MSVHAVAHGMCRGLGSGDTLATKGLRSVLSMQGCREHPPLTSTLSPEGRGSKSPQVREGRGVLEDYSLSPPGRGLG